MILDVGQTCDLKPTHRNHIKIVSKSCQNRIKIISNPQKPVPGLFLCLFLKPTHWKHIKTVSTSYQNRIKIVSKTISKPQKPSRNRPKGCPRAVSVSFLETNPSGTLKKALRSQTISKPYQNHIQNIPKPYLNHNPNHIKNITKPYRNHKPKFKTYQIHIFQSYQKPY